MSVDRRRVLRALGCGSLAALAGCSGTFSNGSEARSATKETAETPTPASTPPPTAAPSPPTGPGTTLRPAGRDRFDRFGWAASASSDGRTVVVGAPNSEGRTDDATGAAYVFERAGDGLTQRARLAPDDGSDGAKVGDSVSVSARGDRVLVGAPRDDVEGDDAVDRAGSAAVFARADDGWRREATLAAPDPGSRDAFGQAVALSDAGRIAIVGVGTNSSTHVFARRGREWIHGATLRPREDTSDGSGFGDATALSADGRTALIGAARAEGDGPTLGAVYVFRRTDGQWRRSRLTGHDGLGSSVALSRDGRVAAAGGAGEGGAGAVAVFERHDGGWTQTATLASEDGGGGGAFGYAVALSGDGTTVLAGAHREGRNNSRTGAAYVFERTAEGWRQRTKLAPDSLTLSDQFGFAVALSGDRSTAVVGAHGVGRGRYRDAGSAFVFD